ALILCDGRGLEAEASITQSSRDSITLAVSASRPVLEEAGPEVAVYAAIIKRDNFELIAQKIVEVGATRLVPIITHRTIKTALNYTRLRTILKEAAEQSGRGIIPELSEAINFDSALEQISKQTAGFFCAQDGVAASRTGIIGDVARAVFIGPEGGFDDGEELLAEKAGLTKISFGKFTFRAETAAIIAAEWAVTQS
ncbi:MAG: RsmE family RNA methyltransferase, partial [Candidatus Magasanikbacteria bacterium]|nr:RsmE family RNA methyltransferase [Candidatus Magasanikbacteria bacterium]